MRRDVRHSRDCPFCKCLNVYLYKFQLKEKANIAINRAPGNTTTDRFLCDICMAPESDRCQVICTKRVSGGRCWPSIHKGNYPIPIYLILRTQNLKLCNLFLQSHL